MEPEFNMFMENLSTRVRSRRLGLGLTQAAVARISGLKQADVSKIERGGIQKTTRLVGLARALKCSAQWLDTGDGVAQDMPTFEVSVSISHLTKLLKVASPSVRDQASTLMQQMALEPDGPWAPWLAELLGNKADLSDVKPSV